MFLSNAVHSAVGVLQKPHVDKLIVLELIVGVYFQRNVKYNDLFCIVILLVEAADCWELYFICLNNNCFRTNWKHKTNKI